MTFDHFNLFLENILDYIIVIIGGKVMVLWFLIGEGVETKYGSKYGSGGSIVTKVKAYGGGGGITTNMETKVGRKTLSGPVYLTTTSDVSRGGYWSSGPPFSCGSVTKDNLQAAVT